MQNIYTALGLMSGTSLDGLDLACCRFRQTPSGWLYDVLAAESVAYTTAWENDLREAVHWPAVELGVLDIRYGRWLGEQVNPFLRKHQLKVDLVASHGHTIHHRPELGLTVQIGHGRALADACRQNVVCDFRTRDVLHGGQGAPLAPVGDQELFYAYDICLNLGGFSNLSFVQDGKRYAYDTGMANMPLNDLARQAGKNYDHAGQMARSGKLIPELWNALNALPYYQKPFPKSTGYEWYLREVSPLLKASEAGIPDKLHTMTQHIAYVIARDLTAISRGKNVSTLATGGGALNTFLIEALRQKLPKHIKLIIPERQLIDYKEAIIFALMGVMRLRGEANCLPSVTGARRAVSGGELFYPQ